MDKQMWSIHAMEHYLAIKGNEGLIHSTTPTSLKNMMLGEEHKHKRRCREWLHLHAKSRVDKTVRTEDRVVVA